MAKKRAADGSGKKKEPVEKKTKAEDFVIKAKRAPKDPKAPKNPKSAYMFFATTCREELSKSKPGLSFTDTGREVGKKWQVLTEKQKVTWEKKAASDKDRYEREMKKYTPDPEYVAQQAKIKAQGPKLAKDPNKPKRGRTAYLVFCDIHRDSTRKKFPKKSMTEVSAQLAEQWKACGSSERAKCEKSAEKEKLGYDAALAAYVPSDAYQKAAEMVQNAKAATLARDKEGSSKLKDKMKKQRGKVKELKTEIAAIEKKMAVAKKLGDKLDAKQDLLSKAEAKLEEMAPGSTLALPKPIKKKVVKAVPAKKKIEKKKSTPTKKLSGKKK